MSKFKKIMSRHILYIAIICLFIIVMTTFKIRCPIFYLFGERCPTCGVTRALISLLNFDIAGYFYYHPLAIPLAISVLLTLHFTVLKRRCAVYWVVAVTLVLNTVLYIVRIILILGKNDSRESVFLFMDGIVFV